MSATLTPHMESLVRIARAAGEVVMRHYQAGVDARVKSDRSPVTDADEEAEKLILKELAAAFPGGLAYSAAHSDPSYPILREVHDPSMED